MRYLSRTVARQAVALVWRALPSRLYVRRAVAERHRDGARLAAVGEGELHVVARLLGVDHGDDVLHARHRLAVDRGDYVPAGADLLAGDRDVGVAALDAGLVGRPVGSHRF